MLLHHDVDDPQRHVWHGLFWRGMGQRGRVRRLCRGHWSQRQFHQGHGENAPALTTPPRAGPGLCSLRLIQQAWTNPYQIVDECPECDDGHLDLFEDAFTQLGTESAGILDISYSFVSCDITSPLVLHNKSGTSAYWFSMQVVNANEAVASLEVSTDGGSTWQETTRTSYNFFENTSGFGTDSVEVRVTSASGATVVVSSVSCASESQTTAGSNF